MGEETVKILENEQELAEKAKTDDTAFEILYAHYFPKIYGYVYKRVGNQETAEDIVSEVFMKVFAHKEKYVFKNCSFGAWVYRIATNAVIDFYRKKSNKKNVDLETVIETHGVETTLNADVDRTYDAQIVRTALESVSEKYRRVLYLRFFGEKTYEEVAEILDINVNNARVLTHRAIQSFNEAYEQYGKRTK